MSGQPGRAFARRHDDRGWRLRYIVASKKTKRKASATDTTRQSSARKGVLRNAQGRHGRATSGTARTTSPPTLLKAFVLSSQLGRGLHHTFSEMWFLMRFSFHTLCQRHR